MKYSLWIILLVIAFCSCGKSQKEINRERNMLMVDSVMRSPNQFVVVNKYQYHDSIVRQEITYDNGKYILRTIAISNLSLYGIKETAKINFLVRTQDINNIVYDRTLSGNFNYIKNRKKNQFKEAEKYLINAYISKSKNEGIQKKIHDSITLLDNIPVKP